MAFIVFLSDFGADVGVASMKGVCKTVDETLSLFDLSHSIPPFDISAASTMLKNSLQAWPKGTVFCCAIDPPTDGPRRIFAAMTSDGHYIVAPDNGLFDGIEVCGKRDLTTYAKEYSYNDPHAGGNCHGRDIAYCAAMLASGRIME